MVLGWREMKIAMMSADTVTWRIAGKCGHVIGQIT